MLANTGLTVMPKTMRIEKEKEVGELIASFTVLL